MYIIVFQPIYIQVIYQIIYGTRISILFNMIEMTVVIPNISVSGAISSLFFYYQDTKF